MAGAGERPRSVRAFEAAREAGDVEAMAAGARELAADRRFGGPAGAAGYLHEVWERVATAGPARLRIELAVELAREWAYAGDVERARPFVEEALAGAESLGDHVLLASALDAALVTAWGPDDLPVRVATAERLDAVAGRVTDAQARLPAILWRLTTALELLDVVAVRRQLRLLDDLERETGSARIRMVAASRRGMEACLVGDVATARRLVDVVRAAGQEAADPDAEALEHVLTSAIARSVSDVPSLVAEAEAFEGFGTAQGIRSVLAEAALLWCEAGERERAAGLVEQVAAGGLAAVPKDVDWLLTVVTVTHAAAGTGQLDILRDAVGCLAPYVGRGVVNAGAVGFAGVVDDALHAAARRLGDDEAGARYATSAATGYRRLGARWFEERLARAAGVPRRGSGGTPGPTAPDVGERVGGDAVRLLLAPAAGGVWLVGPEEAPAPVPAVKGFRYLRLLLARPGVGLTALELSAAVHRTAAHGTSVHGTSVPGQQDLGETIDRRALADYRRRLAELDADLEQASTWNDGARAARLAAERGFLVDELAAATGLRGRARAPGGDAERARVAVRKSLTAAVQRVREVDERTGRLLADTIRTGHVCSYDPDPGRPVVWVLDRHGS